MLGSTNRALLKHRHLACFILSVAAFPLWRQSWVAVAESMSQSLKCYLVLSRKSLLIPGLICNTGVSKKCLDLHNTWGLPHTQWKQQWCSWAVWKEEPPPRKFWQLPSHLPAQGNRQSTVLLPILKAQRCRVLTKLNLSCRLLSKHHPVLWWRHKTHQTPQTAAPTAFEPKRPESQRNTNGVSRLPAWKPPWG